jgi:hypothetical protein
MEWIDIKDWLLNDGPLRSSRKCLHCQKGAVWIADDPIWPSYCEDHIPWREEDGVD